jgi:heme oxygenase
LKDEVMSQSDANDERIAAPHPFVPPLLAQLRDGTRAAHDRIEAIPGLGILLDPALSAGAYITALKALYAFQAGMYRKLPPLLVNITGLRWPDPDVLQSLTDDLTWFGVALPRPVAGPRTLRTSNSALGTLYLLEGSQLGGRVIGRSVSRSLGVTPGRGGSFFCGRTADMARQRWQAFCTVLAHEGAMLDTAGCNQVVEGARAAFAYLESMLGGSGAASGVSAQGLAQAASVPGDAVRTVN